MESLGDPKAQIAKIPDAKAPVFKIGKKEITQVIEDELDVQDILGNNNTEDFASLLFAGTDILAGSDLMTSFEKMMEKEETYLDRPETWRGELTSILTQFGVPGSAVTKLVGRIPAISKIWKAANSVKGGKASKIFQD